MIYIRIVVIAIDALSVLIAQRFIVQHNSFTNIVIFNNLKGVQSLIFNNSTDVYLLTVVHVECSAVSIRINGPVRHEDPLVYFGEADGPNEIRNLALFSLILPSDGVFTGSFASRRNR